MWYVIAAIGALDAGWVLAAKIELDLRSLLLAVAAVAVLSAAAWGYRLRAPRLADLASAGATTIAYSVVGGISSYLVVTWKFPFVDADYAAIDHALGLDWPHWYMLVNAQPCLSWLFSAAYQSAGMEIFLGLILLPLFGRIDIVREFQWAVIFSIFVIIPFSGIFPAVGPWVVYHTPRPTPWIDQVLAMRAHAFTLKLTTMTGIVVCPSFHTTLGVLLTYAARFRRPVLIVAAMTNGLMILAVPSEGSHYFVDVLAGGLVALGAILVTRIRWSPPVAEPSLFAGR